jgi:hypothetical protein
MVQRARSDTAGNAAGAASKAGWGRKFGGNEAAVPKPEHFLKFVLACVTMIAIVSRTNTEQGRLVACVEFSRGCAGKPTDFFPLTQPA